MWRLCGNHLVKESVDHRNVSFDTQGVCAESVCKHCTQHDDFHCSVGTKLPTILYSIFLLKASKILFQQEAEFIKQPNDVMSLKLGVAIFNWSGVRSV